MSNHSWLRERMDTPKMRKPGLSQKPQAQHELMPQSFSPPPTKSKTPPFSPPQAASTLPLPQQRRRCQHLSLCLLLQPGCRRQGEAAKKTQVPAQAAKPISHLHLMLQTVGHPQLPPWARPHTRLCALLFFP